MKNGVRSNSYRSKSQCSEQQMQNDNLNCNLSEQIRNQQVIDKQDIYDNSYMDLTQQFDSFDSPTNNTIIDLKHINKQIINLQNQNQQFSIDNKSFGPWIADASNTQPIQYNQQNNYACQEKKTQIKRKSDYTIKSISQTESNSLSPVKNYHQYQNKQQNKKQFMEIPQQQYQLNIPYSTINDNMEQACNNTEQAQTNLFKKVSINLLNDISSNQKFQNMQITQNSGNQNDKQQISNFSIEFSNKPNGEASKFNNLNQPYKKQKLQSMVRPHFFNQLASRNKGLQSKNIAVKYVIERKSFSQNGVVNNIVFSDVLNQFNQTFDDLQINQQLEKEKQAHQEDKYSQLQFQLNRLKNYHAQQSFISQKIKQIKHIKNDNAATIGGIIHTKQINSQVINQDERNFCNHFIFNPNNNNKQGAIDYQKHNNEKKQQQKKLICQLQQELENTVNNQDKQFKSNKVIQQKSNLANNNNDQTDENNSNYNYQLNFITNKIKTKNHDMHEQPQQEKFAINERLLRRINYIKDTQQVLYTQTASTFKDSNIILTTDRPSANYKRKKNYGKISLQRLMSGENTSRTNHKSLSQTQKDQNQLTVNKFQQFHKGQNKNQRINFNLTQTSLIEKIHDRNSSRNSIKDTSSLNVSVRKVNNSALNTNEIF